MSLTEPGSTVNRRSLIKSLAAAAAAAAIFRGGASSAAESPHLDVEDPAAAALGYVENATKSMRKNIRLT